jgi:hypothetical protein
MNRELIMTEKEKIDIAWKAFTDFRDYDDLLWDLCGSNNPI